jgi:hypothetical protein
MSLKHIPQLEDRIAATLSSCLTAHNIAPQFLEFIAVALCHDSTGDLARNLYRATLKGMSLDIQRVLWGMGSCYLEQLYWFSHARLINALDDEDCRRIWGDEEDRATVGFIAVHLKDRKIVPLPWKPTGAGSGPEDCPNLETWRAKQPHRPGLLLGTVTNSKGEPHEWIYGSKDTEQKPKKRIPKKRAAQRAGVVDITSWRKKADRDFSQPWAELGRDFQKFIEKEEGDESQ